MQRMKFGDLDLSVIDPHERDTQYIYDEIFVERQYDHPSFKLPAASTIFDVGANIGLFCIWAHQVHRPRAIHAFEASPVTFAYLQDNIARYVEPGTTHVRAINKAVARAAGKTLTLHQSPLVSGISTLLDQAQVPWVKSLSDSHEIIKHQVPTTTLSEEIRLQDIQSIDLLKIDVEGYYMEVLGGLDDAGFARVRNAVIEIEYADVTGAGPDEVDRLFRAKGFKTDPREQTLYAWRE